MPKLKLPRFNLASFRLPSRNWLIGLSLGAVIAVAGTAYAGDALDTVSRAEVQARTAWHFSRLDINRDGTLNAADRTARQSARFEAADGNRDGQISRDEFTLAHQGAGRGLEPGMDSDRRGWRGHRGQRRGARHLGHGGPRGAELLAAADANHDSAISQAEFSAAALARFDRADANHDGTLTRSERRAARAAMRAARGLAAPAAPPAAPAT